MPNIIVLGYWHVSKVSFALRWNYFVRLGDALPCLLGCDVDFNFLVISQDDNLMISYVTWTQCSVFYLTNRRDFPNLYVVHSILNPFLSLIKQHRDLIVQVFILLDFFSGLSQFYMIELYTKIKHLLKHFSLYGIYFEFIWKSIKL